MVADYLGIESPVFDPYELYQEGSARPTYEATRTCSEALHACACIILCLSGIRNVELENLRRNSFREHVSGGADMTRKLIKTHKGQEGQRALSGRVLKAWKVACYINRGASSDDDLLFKGIKLKEGDTRLIAIHTEGFKKFVWKTLDNNLDEYSRDSHVSPSPHRFRHAFVEVAVRRFDGNVYEAIRIELGHAVGSLMTNDYTRRKFREDAAQLSNAYIKEIILRVDDGEQMFGPVAALLVDIVKDYDIKDPDEFEEVIEMFDVLEVSEYSFCMMPKAQKTMAKCLDPETKSPLYSSAKFELCGGCAGRLSLANHRDPIMRAGWAAEQQISQYEDMGLGAACDLARTTLKLATQAIKEFDNKIHLVDVTDVEMGNEA